MLLLGEELFYWCGDGFMVTKFETNGEFQKMDCKAYFIVIFFKLSDAIILKKINICKYGFYLLDPN